MLTRAFRRGLRRQEGQALVLACLLMLILSIALMTTVNIGHSVHERIRLQNTADAAAYSTAAMEARAFNFYAFTNRTQVSHYVSAMIWQSTDSFLFSVQAFLTDMYGLIRTIGPCFPKDSRSGVFWPVICGILDNLPYIGVIMKALDAIISALKGVLLLLQPILDFADQVIGTVIIPAHRVLNSVMAGAATAVMLSTSTYVMGTSNAIIQANDPNVDSLASQAITGAINQCLYSRAHYEEANGKPLSPANPLKALDPSARNEDSKVARAKRVMAGITNATRYACNKDKDNLFNACPETMVTDRRLGQLLPIPDWLKPLEMLLDAIPKWGQTRFLTFKLGYGDINEETKKPRAQGKNKIREVNDLPDKPMGMLAQGDVLGSDDPYYIKMGPASLGVPGVGQIFNPFSCPKYPGGGDDRTWRKCWGDPREDRDSTLEPSIWAMSSGDYRRKGIHWRVVFPGEAKSKSDKDVGLYQYKFCVAKILGVCVFKLDVFTANTHIDKKDNNHPWDGIVPFPHFEPGDYANDCAVGAFSKASIGNMATREHDFNQPSTWVMLNKNTQQLHNTKADATGATHNTPALLNSTGKLTVTLGSAGAETLDLDNDRKKFLSLAEGMNVISRGQTYYHRPGNWAEQPNFFNPYWRPRLAAVWQGKNSLPLINQLSNALPAAVKDAPAKIITH
ncbi:hypothetical protein MEBOL_008020 [Melittangium boletus DSM 14713]|uniref:Putative Flp pilus-assembly TadG-like N-terminal domain-containing protein n=1 Tax=Melittangium boletus DSM 14713 TaxID=1294270 RepID=A0A250IRY2_9BACT|nr:pilus assembly protein TadG-related protein [Melittangium boletus]ATB34515.1 hypothetical protein MEBOL_008020 [Melittangium boletus DSM 14713]